MKLPFLPSEEEFNIKPCVIAGDACALIFPKNIGAKWTKDNLIFRSSIWNLQTKELVSASFTKFFNWSEQPELAASPTSTKNLEIIEKIDGSTLVVSKYRGEYIIRTRGTTDATALDNGDEIALLKQKFPQIFGSNFESKCLGLYLDKTPTWNFSLLFEWVSPANKIVINYGDEPDLYLIGAINHADYSMYSQNDLDKLAIEAKVKRPRRFSYNSFDEMFAAIQALDYAETRKFNSPQEYLSQGAPVTELSRNFEGFCVYFNRGQVIRKVKSAWYLALHKMKSELGSFEKVLDLWMTLDCRSFQQFYDYVATTLDYEIAESSRGDASKIADATKQVDSIIAGMTKFAEGVKPLATKFGFQKGRKKQAEEIFKAYGDTNRASFVFAILDGKSLTRDQKKKLFYQVLK